MSKNNPTNATIITRDNIVLYANGQTYPLSRKHERAADVIAALNAGEFTKAVDLIDRTREVREQFSGKGGITVEAGVVYFNGKPVHNVVATRIAEFARENLPYQPLVQFLKNLLENPSYRSREQTYRFLEHRNMPITEDGCFLAYKYVRSDYYSVTAGYLTLLQGRSDPLDREDGKKHIYNGIGEIIECVRGEVVDNPDEYCREGLHVGALGYMGGNLNRADRKIVIVKVNPKDAVSVPYDSSGQKLRCCKYEVIADYKGEALKDGLATNESITHFRTPEDAYCANCAAYIGDENECDECGAFRY